MATYKYRAATPAGQLRTGVLEGASRTDAIERVKRLGLMPIETVETTAKGKSEAPRLRLSTPTRRGIVNAVGELAVLLNAGLALDRALAVCVENITRPPVKAVFAKLRDRVRHGASLARAMQESDGAFSPMASAMAEAGEASGKLDESLGRLAETMERAETLRQTIVSSMVYPAMLIVIATSVILVMLLFVVPQFEDLFSDTGAKLPFMTEVVIGASHAVKNYGIVGALLAAVGVYMLVRWVRQPAVKRVVDRQLLNAPVFGAVIRNAETARFARTLGSLLDGGVPLASALHIAQRSIANMHMSEAVDKVSSGLRQGGGLSRPLAATGLFPPMALSFLRTGEETAQLGLMLGRLADVLDREVRNSIQRVIAVLTPAITVIMGAIVAGVIASIMSAILGFNDLAVGP
ncbi:MAG TPA: type II secretion system F family protein [Rhizomicrobium sp.]|jgi:general secretion pathway protein F|nr:type II secretion system F family protein [Rhizomicrobium sp.]